MSTIVKTFIDNSHLEFDRGGFDDWCVYYVDDSGNKHPPLDKDYFRLLKIMADRYGARQVADFVNIYNNTGKVVNATVLNLIDGLANSYGQDSLRVNKLFTTLYMAMIAEENYPNTRLGRRIKRLGVYELLFSNREITDAADFMRDMGWREIDKLCRQRGF